MFEKLTSRRIVHKTCARYPPVKGEKDKSHAGGRCAICCPALDAARRGGHLLTLFSAKRVRGEYRSRACSSYGGSGREDSAVRLFSLRLVDTETPQGIAAAVAKPTFPTYFRREDLPCGGPGGIQVISRYNDTHCSSGGECNLLPENTWIRIIPRS